MTRLSVRGLKGVGQRSRNNYCRLLGLSLLYCLWDDNGRLRTSPLRVTAASAENFEVHHRQRIVRFKISGCDVMIDSKKEYHDSLEFKG